MVWLAKRQFYLFQDKHVTIVAYCEQFDNILKVLEACGVSIGEDEGIMQKVLETQGINPNTATAA